jgi:hypothetical protein
MDFTDDQILQLINEYEKYPVLWDPKDKFYKLTNHQWLSNVKLRGVVLFRVWLS